MRFATKIAVTTATAMLLLASATLIKNSELTSGNFITGSFTEAEEPETKGSLVENISWSFSNGKNGTGRITRQNFSEGIYNVTVTVQKSNGDIETYKQRIKVSK